VGVDATLLGPRPSLAPGNLRSLANPSHPVSLAFVPTVIHLLTALSLCSEDPAWKRLITHTPTVHERISLITTIFSDDNQAEMVKNLSGDDAQKFIDVLDGVSFRILSPPRNG